MRSVVNVKRLRETLGLTQEEFAERYRTQVLQGRGKRAASAGIARGFVGVGIADPRAVP